MKKTLKSIVLLGALCGGMVHATFEFRSPLTLDARGYRDWLLATVDQAWWYDMMPSEKKNIDWNTHIWGAAYTRVADKAFFDECADGCDDNKITRHTTSLSQLFFGQAVFRGEQAFPGGTFAGSTTEAIAQQALVNNVNPFLSFARISPVFNYSEQGADMGVDFNRLLGKNKKWHVGARAHVPFKVIEVSGDTNQETLDDVVVTRILSNDEGAVPTQIEYAMRFDFLSSLVFQSVTVPGGTPTNVPVVRYNDSGTATASIDVTGIRVSGPNAGTDNSVPFAYITKEDNGDIPVPPFSKLPSQVAGALDAGGQGLNGATLFFQDGVAYASNLANDRDAQGTLFLVPHLNSDGTLPRDTTAIRANVFNIIGGDLLISEPASTFFLNNGIDLTPFERVVGLGDFAAEVYGGYANQDSSRGNWFVDGIFGLQFPTGKKQECANKIYYKPTGNNGHLEVKLAIDGGWRPREWFGFEIDASFNHACQRSEKRAAPFKGATVINVGPEVDVDVSWNYFVLHTDFLFFHPHNPDMGFTLGYELFAKSHDHVSLDCQTTATDLLGRTDKPLDVELYKHNTNSFSNKLRGEIFHRWNYFEVFGGGSQILSGRNMMKETEGHIGLVIYF